MEDFGSVRAPRIVNQSKYVIGSVRTYEYFGHEWRLPFRDVEYLDYWENAPLSAKAHQSLYKEALVESNWGGVWRDGDVNPNRISPRWIIPVRFFFKVVFAVSFACGWHRFERRYLDYFMATTCSHAPWPYFDVVRDKRQPSTLWLSISRVICNGKDCLGMVNRYCRRRPGVLKQTDKRIINLTF